MAEIKRHKTLKYNLCGPGGAGLPVAEGPTILLITKFSGTKELGKPLRLYYLAQCDSKTRARVELIDITDGEKDVLLSTAYLSAHKIAGLTTCKSILWPQDVAKLQVKVTRERGSGEVRVYEIGMEFD